jgi:carboxylate-amine ligase
MELELQLLDATTLDLTDGILPLMQLYPGSSHIKPEFIQNTVEVASSPCDSVSEVESEVHSLVDELKKRCRDLGIVLCGAGCHPFGERLAIITPLPRYLGMERVSGLLGHMQVTFATHVHIGMSSGEQAAGMMRELKPYIPVFLALAAGSPFWRGYETGFVCYRQRILSAARSYGIPPSFDSWQRFCDFFEASQRAGMFTSVHDIHWDIRPRPHLGTLELRVMDAQPTVARAAALAALMRALVGYLGRARDKPRPPGLPGPLPWWLEKENYFQASRLGLTARYFIDERGTFLRLGDVCRNVIGAVADVAADLGEAAYLERLREDLKSDLPYMRQRRVYKTSGSLKAVVSDLVDLLNQETRAAPRAAAANQGP